MRLTNQEEKYLAMGAVLVIGYLVFVKGAAGSAAKAVTSAAGDVVGGSVIGIGDSLGVPETDQSQCQQDLAEGRMWDASFSCPAGTFIKNIF